MKKISVLFVYIFTLLALTGCAFGAANTGYAPLEQRLNAQATGEKPLPPNFIRHGAKFWFNGFSPEKAGNNFEWSKDGSGAHCLMILLDAVYESGANKWLHIPKYGLPKVNRTGSDIRVTWTNPADPNDTIELVFPVGSKEMRVEKNSLKGKNGYKIGLPVGASDCGDECYYAPLFAILNEVGGGVMYDPFGDGVAFIFTGGALQGYSGVWEVADDTEYRVDVKMGGKTVSVGNYWWSLELRPDGTFTEIDRHYQDSGDWIRTEFKGRFAFFGRILAMKYTSDSVYRGEDFNDLPPVRADAPFEGKWGAPGDVYAEYVDGWDKPDVLNIRNSRTLYSKELSGRKW